MELISKSVLLVRYMRGLLEEELPLMNLSLHEYGFYDRMPSISLRMFDEISKGRGKVLCYMFSHDELNDECFLEKHIIDIHNRNIKIQTSKLQQFITSHKHEYKRLIIQDILKVFQVSSKEILDVFALNKRKQFTIMNLLLYKYNYDCIRERVLRNIDDFTIISALFDNQSIDVEELFAYIIETHFDISEYISKDDLLEYLRI